MIILKELIKLKNVKFFNIDQQKNKLKKKI